MKNNKNCQKKVPEKIQEHYLLYSEPTPQAHDVTYSKRS